MLRLSQPEGALSMEEIDERLARNKQFLLDSLEKYTPENVDILVNKYFQVCFERHPNKKTAWEFQSAMRKDLMRYGDLLRESIITWRKLDKDAIRYEKTYHEAIFDGKYDPWIRLLETEKNRKISHECGFMRHLINLFKHRVSTAVSAQPNHR